MSTQPKTLLTPEQYLEIERKAEFKSEYHAGEMFAMAGASYAHNLVVANLVGELREQLRSRPCNAFPSDIRVRASGSGLYTYPDVVVVCDGPRFADDQADTLLNPRLIAEVLSPFTEAYDRGRKFELYQALESFREYLLLASDRMHADLYTRQADGRWLLSAASRAEDSLVVESIGVRLTLADLYEKVDFGVSPAVGI